MIFYRPIIKEPDFRKANSLEEAIQQKKDFDKTIISTTIFICEDVDCGHVNQVNNTTAFYTTRIETGLGMAEDKEYINEEIQVCCDACSRKHRVKQDDLPFSTKDFYSFTKN